MAANKKAIEVKNLKKAYGDLKVLKGVSFSVPAGGILAMLGPNGAGKTTSIKILSTLLVPDSGSATIEGVDVVAQPDMVRAKIGLTGQYAAVDEYLTGRENLIMIARLYRMNKKTAHDRADELLREFDLVEASKRPVKTYSGGMRRRLDLAMSLIANPPVIFLDEPTTGLDPRSRNTMWSIIKRLAQAGTTILLTTQYMEEADQLADNIIVIDHGKVIAEGTAAQLKSKIGSDRIELSISRKHTLDEAAKAVSARNLTKDEDTHTISLATKGGVKDVQKVLEQLTRAKVAVDGISLHQPTLDDVFLTLTGKATRSDKKEKK